MCWSLAFRLRRFRRFSLILRTDLVVGVDGVGGVGSDGFGGGVGGCGYPNEELTDS